MLFRSAHAIALIAQQRFGLSVDPQLAATLAVFHDATEVLTGDLPTPVKYASPELKSAYKQLEQHASERLLRQLPAELRDSYAPLLRPVPGREARIVKAADRISAYVKCLEEQRAGNREFDAAAESILNSLRQMDLPEAQVFLEEYVPAFRLTLDELNTREGEDTGNG